MTLTIWSQTSMDVHVVFVGMQLDEAFDRIADLALVFLHVVRHVAPLNVGFHSLSGSKLFSAVGTRLFLVVKNLLVLLQAPLRGEHF